MSGDDDAGGTERERGRAPTVAGRAVGTTGNRWHEVERLGCSET